MVNYNMLNTCILLIIYKIYMDIRFEGFLTSKIQKRSLERERDRRWGKGESKKFTSVTENAKWLRSEEGWFVSCGGEMWEHKKGPTGHKTKGRKHMCSHEFLELNTHPCASPLSSLSFICHMISITTLRMTATCLLSSDPTLSPTTPPPLLTLLGQINHVNC